VLAHAEATLAAERVAVAARRRAIMEKDLASEIAELSAARAEVVQVRRAAACSLPVLPELPPLRRLGLSMPRVAWGSR
jgi:hypothetical protein